MCIEEWSITKKLKSDQDGIERGTKDIKEKREWSVEIRPRWDWKILIILLLILSNSCWNQTKMGLKEGDNTERVGELESRLKSDQDGIERHYLQFLQLLRYWRVEIRPRWDWKHIIKSYLNQCFNHVEIRPRWDWKEIDPVKYRLNTTALKSDQDGIESSMNQTNQTLIYYSWNQTKMGLKGTCSKQSESVYYELKSDQDGIERI